ncbi:MAG: DNA polymerase Y family protein [bacterium]|nr:DNA polymerase Y family protein [bacterium]
MRDRTSGRLVPADQLVRTERLACVDVPALPLQLLLRRYPDWRGRPAAVVVEDSPQAPLLWVNEPARRHGVLPGMRYASALSVCRELQAAPITERRIGRAVAALHRLLLQHSPRVEPARHEPGVFWLDAGGLERLAGVPRQWATDVRQRLRRSRFAAGVAVGFTRFGTYCLARVHRRVVVAPSPSREIAACRGVPLARLDLLPRLRDDLNHLGVRTVGELIALPPSGLEARFGPEAAELVALARGLRFDPLQPVVPLEPLHADVEFEEPETDAWRLLFQAKRLLHPLLDRLAEQAEAVVLLHLDLVLDDRAATARRESLRPAAPSLDAVLLMELVRLRLETCDLTAGVTRLTLELEAVAATAEALELFHRRPKRDPEAALRAVARVRAELGDGAVVRAELRPRHLPETCWRWAPVESLAAPQPTPPRGDRPLVRRLLPRPRPLLGGPADLARTAGEKIMRAVVGPGGTSVQPGDVREHGPHLVSGGWWVGETRRMYHYLETAGGRIVWVFYEDGRWYLQGTVE